MKKSVTANCSVSAVALTATHDVEWDFATAVSATRDLADAHDDRDQRLDRPAHHARRPLALLVEGAVFCERQSAITSISIDALMKTG